jgi:hypothetical protein
VIDIFEKLLERIKNSKEKLVYDINITDNILLKVNEKLGDVNQKVRNRGVELYTQILQQKFCDYNNVLIELVKDENRLNISKTIKLSSSSRVIIGKLGIFINVFHDLDKAITEKRTDMNTFPFLPISTFLIDNINHSKSEIRKIVRSLVLRINKFFGFKRLEPLLKRVDEKELTKLIPDIPEVIDLIPKNRDERKNRASRSNDKQKDPNRSLSNSNLTACVNCGKADKKLNGREYYEKHISEECPMFTTCICDENVEVKNLNNHLLNSCKIKESFKLCKRCKEAISLTEYEKHEKDNKCNPAKNINSSNRCPLCHKDIPPGDKGFVQHLIKDTCTKQKRKDKTISK